MPRAIDTARDADIASRYRAGARTPAIAAALQCSLRSVDRALARCGVTRRGPWRGVRDPVARARKIAALNAKYRAARPPKYEAARAEWPYHASALRDPTVAAINAAVSRALPDCHRAELCQDAYLAMMGGASLSAALAQARRTGRVYSYVSLDAPVRHGLKLHETLGQERALWF